MAQVIDFKAAAQARAAAQSAKTLHFPTFKPARTKRARLADRAVAVRLAAREAL